MKRASAFLLLCMFLLLGLGLVTIASVSDVQGAKLYGDSAHFARMQFFFAVAATVIGIAVVCVPPRVWFSNKTILFLCFAIVAGLVAVHIPGLGVAKKGSARWIQLPGVNLQPSEFIKIWTVIVLSWWAGATGRKNTHFLDGVFIPAAGLAIIVIGFMSQPDLGSSIMLMAINGAILFISGIRLRWVGLGILAVGLGVFIYVLHDPERMSRISSLPSDLSEEQALELQEADKALNEHAKAIRQKLIPRAHESANRAAMEVDVSAMRNRLESAKEKISEAARVNDNDLVADLKKSNLISLQPDALALGAELRTNVLVHIDAALAEDCPDVPAQIAALRSGLDAAEADYDRFFLRVFSDDSYQLRMGLSAFAAGGLTGTGLGKSQFKYDYLPENHTDFILAMVGEELGFAATASCLLLFFIMMLLGLFIAFGLEDERERLLAFGMTLHLCLSGAVNVAVVTGGAPTKGLALPFMSYGGSNLVASFVSGAIIIGLGLRAKAREKKPAVRRDCPVNMPATDMWNV